MDKNNSPARSFYQPYLDFIREQEQHMIQLAHDWSAVNSGSYHTEGLAKMASILSDNFSWLGGAEEKISLPPLTKVMDNGKMAEIPLGEALRIRKRPDAPIQVLLAGHMDTVFAKDDPFQVPKFIESSEESKMEQEGGQEADPAMSPRSGAPSAEREARRGRILYGPGVADLKGGLVVMLKALEALEKSPWAENIGWEVLINPDEEIGSPGSAPLFVEAAGRCAMGLVYEPSLPDGTLVAGRKGSGNFTVLVRGKAAHAGREFDKGRNAVALLAEITAALHGLNGQRPGVTLNVARIRGGEALNVVPDLATLGFNVRMQTIEEQAWLRDKIEEIEVSFRNRNGYSVELHGGFTRPPKPVSEGIAQMQEMLASCGNMLGISIGWQDTGGCCDGNNLAAAGLPNIDTLGVRGGNIHSDREYVLLDSLVERAKLSALLLMRLASGDIVPPMR